MVITRPFYGALTVESLMMAGAISRRVVGQREEFPEDFRRTRRKGLIGAGGFIAMQVVSAMLSIGAGDLLSLAVSLLAIVAFVAILGHLALSKAPIAFEGDVIILKGQAFAMGSIERLDVMIPRGNPGARAYALKLAFTVRGPGSHVLKVVRAAAKTDQVLRMLSGLRERLPAAVICDRSGLLSAHLWCPPIEARTHDDNSSGPLRDVPNQQQRRLRISPEDGDWIYPIMLVPARYEAFGHRGEAHLDRLRRAPASNTRSKIHCPPVVMV